MSLRNYVIEYDEPISNIDRVAQDAKMLRKALQRGTILATERGIHIRDLGPRRPTIRLAQAERWLTA